MCGQGLTFNEMIFTASSKKFLYETGVKKKQPYKCLVVNNMWFLVQFGAFGASALTSAKVPAVLFTVTFATSVWVLIEFKKRNNILVL